MLTNGTSITETNDLGTTVARTVGQASSGAHRAIDAASDAARPAVDHLAAGIHHAVDRVAGTATHAAESLGATSRHLRETQARLTAQCGAQIRDRPMTMLGIAAGVGLLLGWLMRRR
jgi:ElaB/YqjD/DUF883 family membrane-anchored ribosome-binding protein